MALLGLSLIFGAVVLFCMKKPAWLLSLFAGTAPPAIEPPPAKQTQRPDDHHDDDDDNNNNKNNNTAATAAAGHVPLPEIRHQDPDPSPSSPSPRLSEDGQSTPKASVTPRDPASPVPVPAFSLSPADSTTTTTSSSSSSSSSSPSASTLMPPPPRPPALRPTSTPTSTATSTSSSSPASTLRNRSPNPLPARGPGCSTLAPPPTATATHLNTPNNTSRSSSSLSSSSSRSIVLKPGHSPLDWARLTASPTADLRGLGPGAPYLRVTPSMLKRMTGRRGKDAWTALGGKVYNITPYLPFHPGGEPELLRAAGRDGTRLFAEVHPWVNWEGMLAACLVGIYVPEEDGEGGDMEAMD
ncbi:hypothetical protein VTJ83DRAFT_3047 [Remersonia thermophila]|uniref:Cytochrome b5 heme-binding domain-containing protein n=1 Tax=Remersonia thermophila TaxID=72144 RepID=A0ABR4DCY9_9PEZI